MAIIVGFHHSERIFLFAIQGLIWYPLHLSECLLKDVGLSHIDLPVMLNEGTTFSW
jgi:hypothetical protein